MEGEQAPVAPAAAPQAVVPAASEATPTTSTEAAPAAPVANIPADQIEAFNKFVGANGGFEKAFAKLKNDVSNPEPKVEQPVAQPVAPVQQPVQPAQPVPTPDGFITREEFEIKQYFNAMASEPQYAQIADKIRSGDMFGEMAKFGIRPMQNGMFDDKTVRNFFDLYAKTVPAQAPAAPVTTTPTVDYVNVGEQITSRDDALKILSQNQTLGAQGIALHPQTEAAKEFLKNYFKK